MSVTVKPPISKRAAPNQSRSQKTVEQILTAASDLLEEVGFERLSTNLICKRAGLTPPALYRYFPNKYAVLKALGERLMERQNALLVDWGHDAIDPDKLIDEIEVFLKQTIAVTRDMKAGEWIMRSMHASPVLADVRLDSHRRVTRQLSERLLRFSPELDPQTVYERMRLGVELGYALVEMVFDEAQIDEAMAVRNAASMLAHNMLDILQ
ncbi:TetR/AcrR family transcriptional regulator [Hyphomonas sp. FCG-A18]|uniref:TetR/AcrR family transcriptional regulator n=1 Tax=Hyphomonas sp. FCG-A18 TaxID=3080019 RepID=UPI002B296146|nr:TetR/AcrR family transcriptional regulator [Hyphomonas sp. FCG-A18]